MDVNRRRMLIGAAVSTSLVAVISSVASFPARAASATSQLGLAFEYAFQQRATRLAWGASEWSANVGAFNTFLRNARGFATWSEALGKAMPYAAVATIGVLSIGEYARLEHDGWQIFKKKDGGTTTPGSTDQIRSAVSSGGVITYADTGAWYYAYYALGKAYDFPPGFGLVGSWADATGGSWVLAFKPKTATQASDKYPPFAVSSPTSYTSSIPWTDAGASTDVDTLAATLSAAMSNVSAADPPFIGSDFPALPVGALNEAATSNDIAATQSSSSTSTSASASASTSASSSTSADSLLEFPSLPSVAEPPAWFDAWKGPLNSVVPQASQYGAVCPVMTLQVPDQAWPRLTMKNQTFDQYCAVGDQMKPTLRSIAAAFAGISALITILRA